MPHSLNKHYYRVCKNCGANLDPAEQCDCQQDSTDKRIDCICKAIDAELAKDDDTDYKTLFSSICSKVIVGIMPIIDMDGNGKTWANGYYIHLWDFNTHKTSTLCVEAELDEKVLARVYPEEIYPCSVILAMEELSHERDQNNRN